MNYQGNESSSNSSTTQNQSISGFIKSFIMAEFADNECAKIVFHVHLPQGIRSAGEPVVIGNIEELGNWEEVKVKLHQYTRTGFGAFRGGYTSYWYSNPIRIPFERFQDVVKYKYAIHSGKGHKNKNGPCFLFEGHEESDDRVLESQCKNQFDIWMNNNFRYILNGRVKDYMFLEVIYNSVNSDNFKEAIFEYDAILKAHRELTVSATNFEFICRRTIEESLYKRLFLCFLLGHCRPNFVGIIKLPYNFQYAPLLKVIDKIQLDTFPSNNLRVALKGIELLIHRDIERESFIWLKIFAIAHHVDPQYKFIDTISFVGNDKYFEQFVEMLSDNVIPFIFKVKDESIDVKISKWLINHCNNTKTFSIVWQLLTRSEEIEKQLHPYMAEWIEKIILKCDSVDLHKSFTEIVITEIMKTTNKQNDSLPRGRGRSLDKDFRQLINDNRFHDIDLKCSDGVTISGCKAILATRSDIFNNLIFTELGINSELSFNDINSTVMKIILEFLYTSKAENLTVDNIVEVYYATMCFGLTELQDNILKFMKRSLKDGNVDVGKKLLSACVEKFSLRVDNRMSRLLVDFVAKNKLEKNEIDSLSLDGLRYLLRMTFDSHIPFATPEFTIWEYALRKAIRKVTQNRSLIEKILNEKSFSVCSPREAEELKSHLTLIHYINLNRMEAEEIKQHVEPFNIFSMEKVIDAYRSKALGEDLEFIRGVPIFKWKNVESNDQLDISNDGFTVEAIKEFTRPKSILGDLIFKGKGVYEWDVLIEKLRGNIYIGICEDLNKTDHRWVLGSDGYVYHKNAFISYDAKFKEGDKVTVHLDMKMKACAFSINRKNKKLVTEWRDISSQVYPIAYLEYGSKLHIEPHIKN